MIGFMSLRELQPNYISNQNRAIYMCVYRVVMYEGSE